MLFLREGILILVDGTLVRSDGAVLLLCAECLFLHDLDQNLLSCLCICFDIGERGFEVSEAQGSELMIWLHGQAEAFRTWWYLRRVQAIAPIVVGCKDVRMVFWSFYVQVYMFQWECEMGWKVWPLWCRWLPRDARIHPSLAGCPSYSYLLTDG